MTIGLTPRGGGPGPLALLTSSIAANGTQLILAFNRPATVSGPIGAIVIQPRGIHGADVAANVGNVVTINLYAGTVYSDDTGLTLDFGSIVFQDSDFNDLPEYTGFPVANNSTVYRTPSALLFADFARMREDGTLYQDLAKTIQADADGDPVRVVRDGFNAQEETAASDAGRMILTDLGGGKWGLVSDGVDDGYVPSAGISLSGASTIGFVASQSDVEVLLTRVVQSFSVNALISVRRSLAAFVQSQVRGTAIVSDADYHVIVLKKSAGGNWELRVDGTGVSVDPVSSEFGTVGIGYGTGSPPFPETFTGTLAGLVVCNANLTGTDLTALESYLAELAP
jgi:hypothetical protein